VHAVKKGSHPAIRRAKKTNRATVVVLLGMSDKVRIGRVVRTRAKNPVQPFILKDHHLQQNKMLNHYLT
jgi:hypothetical protein